MGADSIAINLDREKDYYPGDIIELEISVRSDDYARHALQEPQHRSARYLETQPFPVRKRQDGRYEQRWIVLYQVSRSGDILLQGGSLKNETNPDSDSVTLEPASIVSQGFGEERDSNTPVMLANESDARARSRWAYFLVALAGICVGAYAWWIKNKRVERVAGEQKSPLVVSAERLVEKLESGQTPTGDLERFLRDYESACSPSLIDMIEQVVYSNNGQIVDLKDSLRKEFSL